MAGTQVHERPLHIYAKEVQYCAQNDRDRTPLIGPISLDIVKGEFLSIVGPFGCGKTTLLKILAGILNPTSGSIDAIWNKDSAKDPSVGVAFETPALVGWRNILGNILLQVELRGHDPAKYLDRARWLIASFRLGEYEDQRPHQLTPWVARRVSLCQALIYSPSLLLLDEPFWGLDSIGREELAVDLQRYYLETDISIVLTTCNFAEAILLSDRLAVLSAKPGRIVQMLTVDIPRPRRFDKASTPLIAEYCNLVRTTFRAHGVLS